MLSSATVVGLGAALACAAGCSDDESGASGLSEQPQVFVVGADGKGLRRVTRFPDTHGRPVWSPDGRRIAAPAGRVIEVVEVGDGRQRIIRGAFVSGPIAWEASGRELSVIAVNGLGRVAADGSVVRRTASFRQHPGSDSAWSRDGRKLAFRSVKPPRAGSSPLQPARQDLVSTRIDGRERRVLVRGRRWAGHPAWSPDGSMLSFATAPPGGPIELWVVGADGSDARPLLRGLGGVSVSWARDRRMLAAGIGPGKGRVAPGLYALRLPRGRPRRLAPATGEPAWSPDDRTIVFASGERLEAIRPDGRGQRTVVRLPGAHIVYVAWSPSGREIAFTASSRSRYPPGPPPAGTR